MIIEQHGNANARERICAQCGGCAEVFTEQYGAALEWLYMMAMPVRCSTLIAILVILPICRVIM